MKETDFQSMSRKELRTYLLRHRSDERAFQAYMDRLADAPTLASGTLADLQDSEHFAQLLQQVDKAKKNM
ncbi:hypothetical protein [Synechococcus sp. PCC 7336]|uniref:DUF6887 family protein n=1 Tax=Synechococcus sp. PCC 7336 TaxID=195250 RepID=UPI000346A3A5|nr:hypothetical protein [Synechococcus sp. PCC 7336]